MLVIGAVVLIVLLAPTRPEPPSRCLSPPPLRVEIGAVTPGSYQPTVRVLERQIEPGTRVAPEDYDDALQAARVEIQGGGVSDERLRLLRSWLEAVTGRAGLEIVPASGDASFRRYFRTWIDGESRIVMDAPPEREDCHRFVNIARAMAGFGVHVPEVIETNFEQGYLLLSDLGTRQYQAELTAATVEVLYGDALAALLRLQMHGVVGADMLPPYDAALLQRELGIFREWFVERHLGLTLTPAEQAMLEAAFAYLIERALQQPRVWVHRDYHSRNLMLVADNNPGILDFQDAVWGPVTYDLVSLLRDCYITWPEARVRAWAEDYRVRAIAAGVVEPVEPHVWQAWFDLMGMQRHLKAIGIFARLNHRDGKSGYLQDIPRTFRYVMEVAGRYPALAPMHTWLAREIAPRF